MGIENFAFAAPSADSASVQRGESNYCLSSQHGATYLGKNVLAKEHDFSFVIAAWDKEGNSAISYWTIVHFVTAFVASLGLFALCVSNAYRFLILMVLAILWELFELIWPSGAVLLASYVFCICSSTMYDSYDGDHWSNSFFDVLAAALAFAVVCTIPLPWAC